MLTGEETSSPQDDAQVDDCGGEIDVAAPDALESFLPAQSDSPTPQVQMRSPRSPSDFLPTSNVLFPRVPTSPIRISHQDGKLVADQSQWITSQVVPSDPLPAFVPNRHRNAHISMSNIGGMNNIDTP